MNRLFISRHTLAMDILCFDIEVWNNKSVENEFPIPIGKKSPTTLVSFLIVWNFKQFHENIKLDNKKWQATGDNHISVQCYAFWP
jgi:hypothetical protein